MKFPEFDKQMQRLVKVYGTNKYPAERIEMIFEAIGSIDQESLHRQVSIFIGSSDKAPLLQEFSMALSGLLVDSRKREIEEKLKDVGPCINCNGCGSTTMYDKETGWEYAFQCTCPRGHLLQPGFPKQYSGMGDKYVSHRAWAAGRFDRIQAIKNVSNIVFEN